MAKFCLALTDQSALYLFSGVNDAYDYYKNNKPTMTTAVAIMSRMRTKYHSLRVAW